MLHVDVHCIEMLGRPRLHLRCIIESAGTLASPTYLCHLHDTDQIPIVIGRLDDQQGDSESLIAFAARCIAEALSMRPKLEPLSASGQGSVLVRSASAVVAEIGFGFADGQLYSGRDLTRGHSLAGVGGYWPLAQQVLLLHSTNDAGSTT